jgi:hypothetical protein
MHLAHGVPGRQHAVRTLRWQQRHGRALHSGPPLIIINDLPLITRLDPQTLYVYVCSPFKELGQGSQPHRRVVIQGPKALVFRKFWEGPRPADRFFGPETGGVSTRSPAKLHSPRHTEPLVGSWSKWAKALPPAGRSLQEEFASPELGGARLMADTRLEAPVNP